MNKEFSTFSSPRKLLFGIGAVKNIGTELSELGAKNVFIVCDPIATEVGLIDPILSSLEDLDIEYGIWDNAEPEPFSPSVQDALDEARENEYDSVIGVGGGSTMDTGKMVALLLDKEKDVRDYFSEPLPSRSVPFILAPTTSGTGSEVSNCTIIGDPKEDFKHALYSSDLYPDIAIVDPLLAKTAPPDLTARSGSDALSHAIEAYVSKNSNPITDMFAERAIRLVNEHLRSAYSNGENMEARLGMAKSSLFAGLAFGNAGTVIGHALGYAHAYLHHSPHGVSVSVTQPYAMEYNIISNMEKFARIASLLGEETEKYSLREAAFQAPKAYLKLLVDLDMPTNLKDMGATKADISEIANNVFDSKAHVSRNPREVTEEGMKKVVERSLTGALEEKLQKRGE